MKKLSKLDSGIVSQFAVEPLQRTKTRKRAFRLRFATIHPCRSSIWRKRETVAAGCSLLRRHVREVRRTSVEEAPMLKKALLLAAAATVLAASPADAQYYRYRHHHHHRHHFYFSYYSPVRYVYPAYAYTYPVYYSYPVYYPYPAYGYPTFGISIGFSSGYRHYRRW
jgi:hypothetical protein